MGDLDQISRMLGSIEAKQTVANDQLSALFVKFDAIKESHTELANIARQHTERLTFLENEVATDILPTVTEVQRLKQRGIGMLTIVGLTSAGSGVIVLKLFKYLGMTF